MNITDIDLKAIRAALAEMEKYPLPISKRPLTARLVDENNPGGDVILVDDAGMIRYSMSRSVYDGIMARSPVPPYEVEES